MKDLLWDNTLSVQVQEIDDDHRKLVDLSSQVCAPLWIGDRVFFVSDHEFTGNLYSCLPDGSDLQRHTDSDDHYVRWPATDGERVVYVLGATLRVWDASVSAPIVVPDPGEEDCGAVRLASEASP